MWSKLSICSLASMACLWISFVALGNHIGSLIPFLLPIALVPMIILFLIGMCWRGSLQTLLSLCGSASTYFGFYIYSKFLDHQSIAAIVTNKLGVGKLATSSSLDSIGTFYFLMGIFAFTFVLLLTFRPLMFRARGSIAPAAFPVWTRKHSSKSNIGRNVMLVPVNGLLGFAEQHLAAKYLYLVILIGGRKYFVSPNEWVPQGSFVLRDDATGSLLGIPKVTDGFNIW